MIGRDRNECPLSCCDSWVACVEQRCTGRKFSVYNFAGYDCAPVCANDDSSTMWILIHQVFQVFDDYAKLDKVLAAFYEGLRMFRKLDVLKYLRSWSLNYLFRKWV